MHDRPPTPRCRVGGRFVSAHRLTLPRERVPVLYFANASSPRIREVMRRGALGMIATPAEGRSPADYPHWCADNGCYGKGYPGDEAWIAWLRRHAAHAGGRCWFATAPDVVGDAAATLARSAPWLPAIRGLGYPAALVAQDGLENLHVPWDTFDVLFVGGTTDWKLSEAARALCAEARARGKRVHVGRVNSAKRYKVAQAMGGVEGSCDGTFLAFGPDVNLPRLMSWVQQEPLPL